MAPFSLKLFLEQLQKRDGVKLRKRATNAVENLESNVATRLAPDLRRFYELYGSHALGCDVGEWVLWPDTYFAQPDSRGSIARLMKTVYSEEPTLIAALTDTMYLGADAGGQVYFAQIHPEQSEVFIYGPGVGELKFLADSFTAFAELNDVDEKWKNISDPEGPDADRIRKQARALKGRVNLTGFDESDLCTDFDETIPTLAGLKLRAKPKSITLQLFARAEWLIFGLTQNAPSAGTKKAPAHDRAADLKNPQIATLAATSVYWLWHYFMFDEKAKLSALVEESLEHRSDLVRATAKLLASLSRKTTPKALSAIPALREAIRMELASPGSFQIERDRKKRETTVSDLTPAQWDARIFAHYEANEPLKMIEAADARLALDQDRENYYPWLQKGIALSMLERCAEAVAPLEQALKRNRAHADIWMNLSLVHAALKDRDKALSHLREAVRLNESFKSFAKSEPTFDDLRIEPEFRKIVK